MTILLRQPWEVLVPRERRPWHWSKKCQIQAIMNVLQRLSLSLHSRWSDAMLAHDGTYWDVLAFSLLQLSFNIHSSNGFSCPIKFFHLKIAIGLALGESWGVACATTEKHWCPVSTFSYFPWEGFPWQTCKNHLRRNKDVNLWIKFRL